MFHLGSMGKKFMRFILKNYVGTWVCTLQRAYFVCAWIYLYERYFVKVFHTLIHFVYIFVRCIVCIWLQIKEYIIIQISTDEMLYKRFVYNNL